MDKSILDQMSDMVLERHMRNILPPILVSPSIVIHGDVRRIDSELRQVTIFDYFGPQPTFQEVEHHLKTIGVDETETT